MCETAHPVGYAIEKSLELYVAVWEGGDRGAGVETCGLAHAFAATG
jgi:hypothetical protein